ncbi:MAG: tetratricopeptide repeat protein [Bacteroidales bacterium]
MKNIRIFSSLSILIIIVSLITSGCRTHKNTSAIEMSSSLDSVQIYLKKGNLKLDRFKYEEALILFNKVIKIDPENGQAYAYRGMAEYHLKDFKGALEDFDSALKIIPDYGEVYDLRGIVKNEMGDKIGACEDWNKSYELGFSGAFELIDKFCNEENKK